MRRNFWLKLIVAVNLSLLVYLAFHKFGRSKTGSEVGDSVGNHDPDSGRGLLRQIFNVVHAPFDGQKSGSSEKQKKIEISPTQLELQARVDPPQDKIVNNEEEVIVQPQVKTTTTQSTRESKQVSKPEASSPLAAPSSSVAAVTKTDAATAKTSPAQKPAQPQTTRSSSSISVSITSTKQNAGFQCKEKDMGPRVEQRSGNYWVFYNYIQAEKKFECHETITYTTHGEYHFLHNLEPLLKRWQGPISVSIYTPGDDYMTALKAAFYYRQCLNSTLVKDFVTFHFYFPFNHMPNGSVLTQPDLVKFQANCDSPPAVIEDKVNTYRNASGLDYPVNVGRNIAREAANSHFIFPSDIELYPNPGLIPAFLDMIRRNDKHLRRKNPRVFVSSIFEIEKNAEMPQTKKELIPLLKNNTVIPFHKKVCSQCHAIPKSKEWIKAPVTDKLNVFHVAKRTPPYSHWEPIYIGTNDDPFYDERLTWEGRSDKMTQGYQLCVLDYDFMILDNAFLMHRPGIKSKAENMSMTQKGKVAAQNTLISKTIMPELIKLYGARKGCEK